MYVMTRNKVFRKGGSGFELIQEILGTSTKEISKLPLQLEVSEAYPNPFNPSTSFELELPFTQTLWIKVYNMLGQIVYEVPTKTFEAGKQTISMDFSGLSAGAYVVVFERPNEISLTRKILLVK
jgi:hypothetical protein